MLTVKIHSEQHEQTDLAAFAVIIQRNGTSIKTTTSVLGGATTLLAAYHGLRWALRSLPDVRQSADAAALAEEHHIAAPSSPARPREDVVIECDLREMQEIIEQVAGRWSCRQVRVLPLLSEVRARLQALQAREPQITLRSISAGTNREAEQLCRQVLAAAVARRESRLPLGPGRPSDQILLMRARQLQSGGRTNGPPGSRDRQTDGR